MGHEEPGLRRSPGGFRAKGRRLTNRLKHRGGIPWPDVILGDLEVGDLLAAQMLMRDCIGDWAPSPWQMHGLFRSGMVRIFVARQRQTLGFVMAGLSPPPETATGTICSLGVEERFRCRGLGSALLAAGEGWLSQMGVQTIRTRVPAESQVAKAFFQGRGYNISELQEGFYGYRRDAVLLVKVLGRQAGPARTGHPSAHADPTRKGRGHV